MIGFKAPTLSHIKIPREGKKKSWGSSRCGSAEMNPTSIHEDAGLILGLAQGVKNPALPRDVVWVTDKTQIWHCCGCGVGQQLQL